MTNQSRRSFLQGSIVGAAALASASVVQAPALEGSRQVG